MAVLIWCALVGVMCFIWSAVAICDVLQLGYCVCFILILIVVCLVQILHMAVSIMVCFNWSAVTRLFGVL